MSISLYYTSKGRKVGEYGKEGYYTYNIVFHIELCQNIRCEISNDDLCKVLSLCMNTQRQDSRTSRTATSGI